MKNKKTFSLRWQIMLWVLFGAITFSALTLYITYRYVNKSLTETLIEEGKIIGANVGELAAEKIIEDDVVALKNIIEKYKYIASIEYILIEDPARQVKTDTYNQKIPPEIILAGHSRNETTPRTQATLINISSRNTEVYDISFPIKEGILGFVRVGMKKSYVDSRIRETIFYLGIVFVIGTFLAIFLAIFIITLQVSRPIAYLTDMAYKISMGDFETPVRVKIRNEIGVLAEAVERMRESLRTSIERLRKKSS
ncbi:MAG: hypothetical protein Kow0042_11170 [Calditrichia bacterium]